MRCLKCLKNNVDKPLYCSGCGSPLPANVTAVNLPEPFHSVIEKQQTEIAILKDALEDETRRKNAIAKDWSNVVDERNALKEENERLEKFIDNLHIVHFTELQREKATVEQYEKLLTEILGYTKYKGNNWYEKIQKILKE
jgi:hypothetical protein